MSGTFADQSSHWSPTAQMSFADTAATSVSMFAKPGFGLATTVQDSPSQCSMSVLAHRPQFIASEYPTAHTSSGLRAPTEFSFAFSAETMGVVVMDHCAPSQCMTMGAVRY